MMIEKHLQVPPLVAQGDSVGMTGLGWPQDDSFRSLRSLRALGLHGAIRPLRALIPCFRGNACVRTDHRDAVLYRANQRTEIAADALGFVHARDAFERRRIWTVLCRGGRPLLAG